MKIALALLALLASLAALPRVARGGTVASISSRCNARMITEMQDEVRSDDRRPPGSQADVEKRFADLGQILESLNQERGIIENVCSTDQERNPLYAQLGATAAWASALQSDLVPRLNDCAAAVKALQTTMLAQGWLDLANVVNDDYGGTAPPPVADVQPKIQSRAAKVGLTLPPFHDTSYYWFTELGHQQEVLAGTCPTSSPAAAPTASPARLLQIIRK
ncbi:MAG TPA: hypothetical protein VME66_03290 [Candidatus Acidoferrales bacterium]|nr:hypothetical protein [Candidatus Acidoferrales bacterium]